MPNVCYTANLFTAVSVVRNCAEIDERKLKQKPISTEYPGSEF